MQTIRRHVFKYFEHACTIKKEITKGKLFTACLKKHILRKKLMNH